MNDDQNNRDAHPTEKIGFLQSLGIKILVLIVFALMVGMCSFKYIS